MSNYSLVEKRKVKAIVVSRADVIEIFRVKEDGVVSIQTIDLKEKVYLVNHESGESELVYDVSNVVFYK